MNPSNQPLSDCHQAPVVFCEGNAWDVPLESIKPGSTYTYGCPVCHKACGLNADAVDSNHTPSIPTTALPGNGQPDAQAGDDDTDVTISHAQAEVGLKEKVFNLVQLYSQCNLEKCSSCKKQAYEITALFQADKAVAVVEALARVRNAIKSMQRVVKDHDDQIHDRAVGNAIWHVENEIARLQPPTAGEGESV